MVDLGRSNGVLFMVCGLQGVGKSTAAAWLAKRQRAVLLRTDKIRDEVIEEFIYTEEGTFTEEDMQKVYQEMLRRTTEALQRGKTVVLDATFAKRENRERVRRVTCAMGADRRLIEVICPADVVEKRMKSRKRDASKATFAHHIIYKNRFEPIAVEEKPHFIISNRGTLKELRAQLDMLF